MCQFVPATTIISMDQGEPNQINTFKSYEIHFPEDKSESETETFENGTQTILTGKVKAKLDQKPEKGIGIKTITGNKLRKKHRAKLMDWRRFHRLRDIYDYIDELERDYPALCTVSVIGKSVEGRDIKACKNLSTMLDKGNGMDSNGGFNAGFLALMNYVLKSYNCWYGTAAMFCVYMLKISNSNASNEAVWIDASIHPREWISIAVVTYIADHLVKNFKKLANCLTNKDWFIVPVLNPDGYEYTHTCNRMWRKNRACQDGNCVGVDLNRNFSFGWGHNGEEGSSEDPNNVFYRGPAPFSEPETAAVRDTILSSNRAFKAFLSFHSYFELIIFPWGFKTDPCPHYLQLLEGAMVMSRAIYESTGYIYKVGSTKDMTYFACGTSIDWSYGVANIPYSYMIELRSRRYKFRLPKDQITATCVESWHAIKSLMDYIDQQES